MREFGLLHCTLNYRAQEILFGSPGWGAAVDMWSFGCLLAELLTGKMLLPGNNMVTLRFNVLKGRGSRAETGLESLPLWPKEPPQFSASPWDKLVHSRGRNPGIELLDSVLQLQASRRDTAVAVSFSPYLRPCPLQLLRSSTGEVAFRGGRADWSLVQGHLPVELLQHLRGDPFFADVAVDLHELSFDGTPKHSQRNAKRQKTEEGRQIQLVGHLGTRTSSSLNALCAKDPLPLPRLLGFAAAFK